MTASTVVIPVRGLAGGKTRLSPVLNEDERARVIFGMTNHVLDVVMAVSSRPNVVVVCQDAALLRTIVDRRLSVIGLTQPAIPGGLIAAINLGREQAIASGSDEMTVLFGDLPLLEEHDLDQLWLPEEHVTVGSDLGRVGTNALVLRGRETIAGFPFLFGLGSRQSHIDAARERGYTVSVAEIAGIEADLDTPEDWLRLDESLRRRLLSGDVVQDGDENNARTMVPLLEHA